MMIKFDRHRVAYWMAEKGIQQVEITEKTGINRAVIAGALKRGKATPRVAGAIAKGLGIPIEEFGTLED